MGSFTSVRRYVRDYVFIGNSSEAAVRSQFVEFIGFPSSRATSVLSTEIICFGILDAMSIFMWIGKLRIGKGVLFQYSIELSI